MFRDNNLGDLLVHRIGPATDVDNGTGPILRLWRFNAARRNLLVNCHVFGSPNKCKRKEGEEHYYSSLDYNILILHYNYRVVHSC